MCVLCNKVSRLLRSEFWFDITQTLAHKQRHTGHSETSRLTHLYKYIFTPAIMCSQQLPLLHWITQWHQNFTLIDSSLFMKGVLSHAHAPTYAPNCLEVWSFANPNQTFDYTFLIYNCLCLIKICANSHVTIKQAAVINY